MDREKLEQSRFSEASGRRVMRRRLPNRRASETLELEVGGLRYTCTVARFSDGKIGELFLSNHKSNSAADCNARDAAIVFSIAVQCGADIETNQRNIGDFTGWKEHDSYQKSFDRLMRELRVETSRQ